VQSADDIVLVCVVCERLSCARRAIFIEPTVVDDDDDDLLE